MKMIALLAGVLICSASAQELNRFQRIGLGEGLYHEPVFVPPPAPPNPEWEKLSPLIIGVPGLKSSRPWAEVIGAYFQPSLFIRVGETTQDLRPLLARSRGELSGTLDAAEWREVRGTVTQVLPEGLLLHEGDNTTATYLEGKFEKPPVDRQTVGPYFARRVGVYQYRTVLGGSNTVPHYALGEIDQAAFTNAVARLNAGLAAIRTREAEQQTARLASAEVKALEFQIQRAAAGSASAQYDLAVRYLEGKGVAQDKEKALELLRKSAAQGHGPARKKIEEIEGK
jgi:hypothetical protein